MMIFIRPTGAPLGVGATLGFAPNGSAASLDTAPVNPAMLPTDYVLTQRAGALAKVPASASGGVVNLLAFGADPTGATDSAPAFAAAIGSVATAAALRIFVPRGSYLLDSVVNQDGRTVAVEFDDGADIKAGSAGYLGVARVTVRAGAEEMTVTNQGYFGLPATPASVVTWNLTANQAVAQTALNIVYTDSDTYKASGGTQSQMLQRVMTAFGLFDTASWLDWSIVNGPIYDELSRDTLGMSGTVQAGEFDVVSNAPDTGWTDDDATGTPATGFAVDPAGASSPFLGGHIRYAFGTAGGVTGGNTGAGALNNRWWTYPALFSAVNPGASGAGAQISITATDGAGTTHGPTTVTVGGTGTLADWASAINAAAIPGIAAVVSAWAQTLDRLVLYSTVANGIGTITLAGAGLAALGYTAGTYFTPRTPYVAVFGGTGISGAAGATFSLNGHTVTVGGAGATADVAAAINGAGIVGITAGVNRGGRLVVRGWCGTQQLAAPYWSGQVMGSLAIAGTGAGAVGLPVGTFFAPGPPLAFATAWSESGPPSVPSGSVISIGGTNVAVSGDVLAIQGAIIAANLPNVTAIVRANDTQLAIRRTDGGALALQDVTGRALDLLGIAPGGIAVTYQPGGYSAGSFNSFFAAPDSQAPGGRGFYAGGSSYSDVSVQGHAPFEARGNWRHGIRLDRATPADGVGLRVGAGHALAFGTPDADTRVTVSNGTLEVAGSPVATLAGFSAVMSAWLATLPTSAGAPGTWWNNNGVATEVS